MLVTFISKAVPRIRLVLFTFSPVEVPPGLLVVVVGQGVNTSRLLSVSRFLGYESSIKKNKCDLN